MKNHIIAAALLLPLSGISLAADVAITPDTQTQACTGTAGQAQMGGVTGTPITTTGSFIKTAFGITCSNNSVVYFTNGAGGDATIFTVGAASLKGNQSVKGSSSSGGVKVHLACNPTCAATDAATAEAAAVTEAGGSS